MTKKIRRIGLLTGGGDCPGLNAVIRAVTKTARSRFDIDVVGVLDGYRGLIEGSVKELTWSTVSGILNRGGTILGSNNRVNPQRYHIGHDEDGAPQFEDATQKCLKTIEEHKIDAMIIIGGDGTMSVAESLLQAGVNCIGVPKTIDNDIIGTDLTFGFTTAMTTATLSLDRLHTTAASHHRVMVCELMGRNAGWLALSAGIASGSDVILIPEIPFDINKLCEYVDGRQHRGRGFSIIACAEGACEVDGDKHVRLHDPLSPDPIRLGGIGAHVADEVEKRTGIETRTTVLGHVQRGGPPVAADRVLATQFGWASIELLMAGGHGRIIVVQDGKLSDIDIRSVANKQRLVPLDDPLVQAARSVKTSFGD
ncbi:MAG: ATP-dependent 6-phosphofructokinase [Phycisphaerales bacterium]|nr:ATP-dependent 6-phosphofructokinase [Phycisphaerales bacterium]